jgi:hypothetical protein
MKDFTNSKPVEAQSEKIFILKYWTGIGTFGELPSILFASDPFTRLEVKSK